MQISMVNRIISALRHQWLIVAVIVSLGMLFAAFIAISVRPKFTATTSVLMVAGSGESSASQQSMESTTSRPLTANDLPAIASGASVLGRLRSDLHESVPLETIRSRIHAKISSDSNIMQVDYTARTAHDAVSGANHLGFQITRSYRALATARFDSLIADFTAQLAARRTELAKLDGQLGTVGVYYPYVDVQTPGRPESATQSVSQRMVSLLTERDGQQATLDADVAIASSTKLLTSNAASLAARDLTQSNPVYSHVQDQFAKDSSELTRLNSFGSERYPGLVELRRTVAREAQAVEDARRQATRGGLSADATYVAALDSRTRADGQVASDQAKITALQRALDELRAQIGPHGVATAAAQLHRDHDNAEASYSIIASRLAKAIADRAEAASTGSLIVLEPAQFASKSTVGSGTIAAVAILFLSIWLALTLAVTIDSRQERFRDDHTIETIYGAPVIGSLV